MNVLTSAVLLLTLILPPALAVLLAFRASRAVALALAPWAALPAFIVAVAGWPEEVIEIEGLLLGAAFGMDTLNRPFLLLTAALWLAGGTFARAYHQGDPKRVQLFAFHLVTLTGNIGLVLARDAVFFYLFFIIMSFAAFGLIVHAATPEARRAGRVYLVLIILGEAMLLPGLWMAVAGAASLSLVDVAANVDDRGGLTILLLAAGFGVKAGVVPLHVWLPLAHPVAPTPASAMLSGAMIKAGVLGWVGFLPLGLGSYPGYALLFIVVGVSATFYGAVLGVLQGKAKAVLAYSSISQMGLMTTAVGIGFLGPEQWPVAAVAVTVYALHHALAKGALFLGVGIVENAESRRARRAAFALLLVPALALAGAPLTSGLIAKTVLKDAVAVLPAAWYEPLAVFLPLAAVGTTLLMAQFFYVMTRTQSHPRRPGLWPPWLALIAASVLLGLTPVIAGVPVAAAAIGVGAWWSSVWPVALGIGAALTLLWLRRQRMTALDPGRRPQIPPGDILWPLIRAGQAVLRALPAPPTGDNNCVRSLAGRRTAARTAAFASFARVETIMARWSFVGSAVVIAVLVVFLMLARG